MFGAFGDQEGVVKVLDVDDASKEPLLDPFKALAQTRAASADPNIQLFALNKSKVWGGQANELGVSIFEPEKSSQLPVLFSSFLDYKGTAVVLFSAVLGDAVPERGQQHVLTGKAHFSCSFAGTSKPPSSVEVSFYDDGREVKTIKSSGGATFFVDGFEKANFVLKCPLPAHLKEAAAVALTVTREGGGLVSQPSTSWRLKPAKTPGLPPRANLVACMPFRVGYNSLNELRSFIAYHVRFFFQLWLLLLCSAVCIFPGSLSCVALHFVVDVFH
jgi:hypothetical protein